MVAAKETAEEQLLRMIEGSGPAPASGRPGRPAAAGWERLLSPLGQGRRLLGQWFGRPKRDRDRSDPFLWQLQLTSRLFWVVLAGLGIYLVVDLGINQPKPPTLLAPGGTRAGGTPGWTLEDQSRQLANYRSTLASRNPFRLSAPGSPGLDPATVKNKLVELTQTLTVVGINRGRVPEALIEDTEAKRTHFVKVGDQLNGLTISRIDEHGVTVSYEGEELTLK
jgi:hypothetical protein